MKKIYFILIIFSLSFNCFSQFNNLYVIERNHKKGFVDNKLDIVIKPKYDDIELPPNDESNFSIVKLKNKYGVIDKYGKKILPLVYERLLYTQIPQFFIFRKEGKFGLIDIKGKEILKPEFRHEIKIVNNGKNFLAQKGRKYFLLNKKGRKITKNEYEYLDGNYNSKIFLFKLNGKYGYINTKGKVIIKPQFTRANNFEGNFAIVEKDEKYGIINKKGKFVLKPVYDRISYRNSFYSDSFDYHLKNLKKVYYISENRKVGLLDENLKRITPIVYDIIGDFNEGYAYVKKNKKYGFINEKGEIVIPIEYDDADCFSEGLAPVVKNGKWGYINDKNKVMIDFKIRGRAEPFFDGRAVYVNHIYGSSKLRYYNKERCGYMDKNGNTVILPRNRNCKRFIKGVARVKDTKNEYLINKKPKKIILKHFGSEDIEEITN